MISWIILAVGLFGIAFGIRCYMETRKWARLCKRSRIVIAYNRRVQLQASLVEWIGWVTALKNQPDRGRIVYRNGKVTVSILHPDAAPSAETTVKTHHSRNGRKAKVAA